MEKHEYIIKAVCNYYNLTFEELNTKSRKRNLVIPRQIIMYMIRDIKGTTFQEASDVFNKNHATTIHAIKTIKNLASYDKIIKRDVEKIIENYYSLKDQYQDLICQDIDLLKECIENTKAVKIKNRC